MRPATLVLLLASACGAPPKTTGTALLRFSVSPNVKSSPNLKRPLLAPVMGGIFLVEDVSISGPRKDAEVFGDVRVGQVDLRSAEVSTEQFVTAELAPGAYTVLAMMDLNANTNVERPSPDPGDLVTLPFSNKFQITAGQQTKRLILFDVVFN